MDKVKFSGGQHSDFNLNMQISQWARKLKSEQSIMDADVEELKCHLLDMMDDLRENSGLDEEEAFIIASRRIGTIADWGDEYRQENTNVLQTRRIVVILSGILIYFFLFHLGQSFSKLFFVVLVRMDVNMMVAIHNVKHFLSVFYIIVIILFSGILLFERKFLQFSENIRIKPRHTIMALFVTLLLGIMNKVLSGSIRELAKDLIDVRSRYTLIYRNYEYIFPLIMCIIFLIIYFKYYKKLRF